MNFNEQFWQEYQRFLKTSLMTELPHPQTAYLSELAKENIPAGLDLLFGLDRAVIQQIQHMDLSLLQKEIREVLAKGGRIFLVGCGASGRMAMQLEYLWRHYHPHSLQVQAVLAGGDIALIEAVEGCEDQPEFALRHLQAIGFSEHDLLIGLSAGGESPFILAAVNYALSFACIKPWLVFCNAPQSLLARNEQHVLQRCQCLYLDVGPMALTGSTRMQATTAMTLSLLVAFFDLGSELPTLLKKLETLPLADLAKWCLWEAQCYYQQQFVLYHVDAPFALSVLADTTERSPTFNLPTFEAAHKVLPALTYVTVAGAADKEMAWQQLLLRKAQALHWPELVQTRQAYLHAFDLSEQYVGQKRERVEFRLVDEQFKIIYAAGQKECVLELHGLSLPLQQLLVRLILVNHSTLVFGRLGFYQGNLMTFVKPSNFKLVDRAVRYIQFLAEVRYQQKLDYKLVAEFVLQERENLVNRVSIVELALEFFLAKRF